MAWQLCQHADERTLVSGRIRLALKLLEIDGDLRAMPIAPTSNSETNSKNASKGKTIMYFAGVGYPRRLSQ